MSRGFFLVLEGTEGAGKTTLGAALVARLRDAGITPLAVREPGGTPVAERVRAILLDPTHPVEPVSELLLFLAARADLVARVVRPALEAGRVVLADRYQLSTEAYQCGGRGLDRELFRQANRAATGGLDPDLTLVLDLPAAEGLARRGRAERPLDRIEQADEAFHERVARVFRDAGGPDLVHLDATRPPDQVLEAAWRAVESRLPEAVRRPPG